MLESDTAEPCSSSTEPEFMPGPTVAGDAKVGGTTAGVPADLRQQTTRGGVISIVSQAGKFVVRTGSMVVLARLLTPDDFGLVGMVTAFTGFLALFKDAGLCMATV